MDPTSGMVTHIGSQKLPAPIPMQEWAEANQVYARIALDYIEATYKAFRYNVPGIGWEQTVEVISKDNLPLRTIQQINPLMPKTRIDFYFKFTQKKEA